MKSVVFCASQRFKKDMEGFIGELKTLADTQGLHPIVFEPNFEDRPQSFEQSHEKERLKNELYRETVAVFFLRER